MKKRNIRIIEAIIWLLIVFCGLSFFVYKTAIKDNSKNIYYIFFDNVAGLVKGSPVRLMGITVGYVKDIKIFDNKVFVSILVTKENVKIPKSATATIEFYGLGGSTSLELNPSTSSENSHNEEIIPSKTYSIKNYWDGVKLTSETMINTYDSVRLSIDNADLLNNKQILFQSNIVKEYLIKTKNLNNEQTVIINQLKANQKIWKEND